MPRVGALIYIIIFELFCSHEVLSALSFDHLEVERPLTPFHSNHIVYGCPFTIKLYGPPMGRVKSGPYIRWTSTHRDVWRKWRKSLKWILYFHLIDTTYILRKFGLRPYSRNRMTSFSRDIVCKTTTISPKIHCFSEEKKETHVPMPIQGVLN